MGLLLDTPRDLKERTWTELVALLPTGDMNTDKRINKAIDRIEQSLNPAWWVSDTEINNKKVLDRSARGGRAARAGCGQGCS